MAQDAEVKFWWIPELVEHLLTFMDPASILNLAHSHSRVEQVLQSAYVWTELIDRVCPYDREEQDLPPTNLIIQRKCEQVRALVGLLHLLQNSENQQLEFLELIQHLSPNVSTSVRIFGSAEVRHTTMGTLSGF